MNLKISSPGESHAKGLSSTLLKFTVGMAIAVSDKKKVGSCSFLIIINIININIIVNILSVLEFVQECALEFVLEFVMEFVLEFVL